MVFPTHQPTLVLISGFFSNFWSKSMWLGPKINLVFIDDNSLRKFQNFLQKGAEWQTFSGHKKVTKISSIELSLKF
jgi:hypothetical protein